MSVNPRFGTIPQHRNVTEFVDMDYKALFNEVGRDIEQRWRQSNYDSETFPDIAAAVAATVPAIDSDEFIKQTNDLLDLNYRFSDYDVRAYHGRGFQIQILHWHKSTTNIHEHAFCGAFRLMSGSSLQIEYEFKTHERINENFAFGDVSVKDSVLLNAGDIRKIGSGSSFIHANFHLERPTCTMVIRTFGGDSQVAQCNYFPPHIRIEPADRGNHKKRLKALVEYKVKLGQEALEKAILPLIQNSTLQECVEIFLLQQVLLSDEIRLDRLLDVASSVHPRFSKAIMATVVESRRRLAASIIRHQAEDDKQRFFLALMCNFSDAKPILHHVAAKFPTRSPGEFCAKILQSLAARGHLQKIDVADVTILAAIIDGEPVSPAMLVRLQAVVTAPLLKPLFDAERQSLVGQHLKDGNDR